MASHKPPERTQESASGDNTEPARDFFTLRIRESLAWLRRTPARNAPPPTQIENNVRDSIRQLSRQRISNILRQLRAAHALTYEQVNERTGLTQQLLFDVEFKERRLRLEEIRLLADCYGVSIDDILGINVDT